MNSRSLTLRPHRPRLHQSEKQFDDYFEKLWLSSKCFYKQLNCLLSKVAFSWLLAYGLRMCRRLNASWFKCMFYNFK